MRRAVRAHDDEVGADRFGFFQHFVINAALAHVE